MVAKQNFKFVNERPDAKVKAQQKWGGIGPEVGAWAELLLDTRTNAHVGSSAGEEPPRNLMFLAHLASYSGMGRARVECVANCVCESSTLDGHWEQKVSLMAMHSVLVSCSCRRARAIDFGMCVCCA